MRQSWAVSSVDDEVMRTSAQYGVENLIIYTGPGTKTPVSYTHLTLPTSDLV